MSLTCRVIGFCFLEHAQLTSSPAIYQIVSSKSLAEEGDVSKKFDPSQGNNISLSQEKSQEEQKGCC